MSKYNKLLIGFIICILCISPIAGANIDWNTFQSNLNHTGYVDDNSDFVTNLWSFNMESPVIGSPAIYGDFLYVVSQEGILKVKCTSVWFAFDTVNLKPRKIPQELLNRYLETPVTEEFDEYRNPEDFDNGQEIDRLTVTLRDIDTNHHLNNQKSSEILMSALPENFNYNNSVIHYKKSAHLKDMLTVTRKLDKNTCSVRLSSDNETCVLGVFEIR